MKHARPLFLLLIALGAALPGVAGEFDWLARTIQGETGYHETRIPMLGLARFAVGVIHPAGTSDFHLAVFEETQIDAERFCGAMDRTVGELWKPIVRVRSMRNGEWTSIYAQNDSKHMRLLIGTASHGSATLVQVRANVDTLVRFVNDAQCHRRLRLSDSE